MRELDETELELQLRHILTERLGSLPFDLTDEGLERRRLVKNRGRRRRRGWIALGLAAAVVLPFGALALTGGRTPFQAFLPPVPSTAERSATPSAALPEASPASPTPSSPAETSGPPTVVDPHALLVLTGKDVFVEGAPLCVNVDRYGSRDGSSRRLVTCGDRVAVTRDGTSAAVGGPLGMSIVDMRDGRELGTIDMGRHTFPTVWSPSGRWLLWSSCRRAGSNSCSVILSARDGSGQHELYRGDDGYASSITWLPDESRVAVPIDGSGSILVGTADGSNLKPLTPNSPESGWAAGTGMDNHVVDRAPDGSGYLYIAVQIHPDCNGQSSRFCRPILADIMSQGLSGGANDGPPVNLTNLVRGHLAVAAAWSPDGQTLAFLRMAADDPDQPQATSVERVAELWLRDASGTMRRIDNVALPEPRDGQVESWFGRIHWSPDGTRLAIEAGNGRSDGAASLDTYLVALDGSGQGVLRDARSVAWSPDGTEIAFVHWVGPLTGDTVPADRATIEVAGADGSERREVVVPSGDFDGIHILWAAN